MRPRLSDDRGLALAAVILLGMVLLLITGAVFARTLGNYNQVSAERGWERSLHVADAGIDHGLYELTLDHFFDTGEIYGGPFVSLADEEAWARARAADAVTGDPARAVQTSEGDWVLVKPDDADLLYSVGYVPDYNDPQWVRLVVVSYDFPPYTPAVAVATGGNLVVSGNATISGSNGSIHSNGDLTLTGNPIDISGYAAASGTYTAAAGVTVGDPANTGGGKPTVAIPEIDPLDAYDDVEYDLCAGGVVKAGPAYTAGPEQNLAGTPCAGDIIDADAVTTPYRGWQWTGTDVTDGELWAYAGAVAYNGSYLIHLGSATISGNAGSVATPWASTVLASASGGCGTLVGGDIILSGTPTMSPYAKAEPLLLVAQRDLIFTGTAGNPFTGVLLAGEQFQITGTANLDGTILSNDACDTFGSPVSVTEIIGNPIINYDGALGFSIGDQIRITHWNET